VDGLRLLNSRFRRVLVDLDHLLGDTEVDGRIILRWIYRKWDVEVWTGSSWLRIGTGGELFCLR